MLQPLTDALRCDLPGDATRLLHGRGQCYAGLSFLNVDWFDPVVWAVLYGDVDPGLVSRISAELRAFGEREGRVECVILQRRGRGQARQEILYGTAPAETCALEDGARFALNLSANQNIGFFLDARPGRRWLRERAAGKRVLNLFAYTCSFSVAALLGGASGVVNIDKARSALTTGERNHLLNDLSLEGVSFLPHDVFRSTRKLEQLGPYDLVICDPPSRQKRSFEADRDYGRLLDALSPMLAPGAELLACVNAPYLPASFLTDAVARHLPDCVYVERLPQREDFPEKDPDCCLKMQVFKA